MLFLKYDQGWISMRDIKCQYRGTSIPLLKKRGVFRVVVCTQVVHRGVWMIIFLLGFFDLYFTQLWLKNQSPPRLQNLYYGQKERQCHPISCPAPSPLFLCNRPAKNNILTMSSAPLVQRSKVVLYHQATQSLVFFVYGWAYWPDHMWTNDELLAVTPKILVRYIKIKVYGSENAQLDV